jgi:phosphoribosylaminoimidazole-succinocarboxamide synthase
MNWIIKGPLWHLWGIFFFQLLGDSKCWAEWNVPADFDNHKIIKTLRQNGLKHHCIGLIDEKKKPLAADQCSNLLAVRPVDVHDPSFIVQGGVLRWDYEWYQTRPINTLVPLEVIFRFGVPVGSSLLSRTKDEKYRLEIGLDKVPHSGDRFNNPIIELSTKLETSDRYLDYQEAKLIAGLSEEEFSGLLDLTKILALRLKDLFAKLDIELWDGKFEFAFSPDRSFMLVDSIGPDELRLIYKRKQLSKESLRLCYRDSKWYQAVNNAKKIAEQRNSTEWKKICIEELHQKPEKLDPKIRNNFSMMYQSLANKLGKTYLGKEVFPSVDELSILIDRI